MPMDLILLRDKRLRAGGSSTSNLVDDFNTYSVSFHCSCIMKKFVLFVILLVCSSGVSVLAQKKGGEKGELRIGVVDVEKIAKELPEAIDADKKLTEMRNKMLDTIKVMEQKFKEKLDAYTKGRSMMTADAQKKEEEELRGMQSAYSVYQEENFGNQGALVRKRNELLQPVLAKIQEAIQAVSKEEGLSFVFDRAASSVLVFADERYDVTFKIIDHMKRSK